MKSVVIKLSSGLIMQSNRDDWLSSLSEQISKLQKLNYKVCLVTSGAAALGKAEHDAKETRQFYAILGQPLLFSLYQQALKQKAIDSAQLLISKEDFKSRDNYLKIRDALHELLKQNIVPLINENDAVHSEKFTFSDNDEIGGLVASLLGSERLVLVSTVDGLLDEYGRPIETISYGDDSWSKYISDEQSEHGTGGMFLKCRAAELLAHRGISTTICSGLNSVEIYKAATGNDVGTKFQPNKQLIAKKRWILDHAQFANASVSIDKRAAEVMRGTNATSLLTVGVTDINGDFSTGEVITVVDPEGIIIGHGQTQYTSHEAKKLIGQQSQKPLIHYDQYVGAL